MKIHLYFCLLFCFILIQPIRAEWHVRAVGSYDTLYEVKVGDGRNDGAMRVYCSSFNGHVVEWSYSQVEKKWHMVDCGGLPPNDDNRMISLWIGQGRNDGLNRIYSACANGNVYEFSYSQDSWDMACLGSPGDLYAGVAVGKARNDGQNRIYIGAYDTPVREYNWNGNTWDTVAVSATKREIWPLFIAPGRNDGRQRLYCPDWSQSQLSEYTWNGSQFEETVIEAPTSLVKAVVGLGRNDGINRVYAAGKKGHIHEFSFQSNQWGRQNIHQQAPALSRYGLCLGRTRSDGLLRLYSVAQGGDIREHVWNDNAWADSIVDATTGATADLTIGPGRNDDTVRIYVNAFDKITYEITHSAPYVLEPTANSHTPYQNQKIGAEIYFYEFALHYYVPTDNRIQITLFNTAGVRLGEVLDAHKLSGWHILPASSFFPFLKTKADGIFFCRMQYAAMQKWIKVVNIKK